MTSLGDGYRDTEQDPHAGSSHVAASPRSQQLPKRDFERFRRLSEQLFRSYFAIAAVAVDSSHMTASSSAS